MATWTLIIYIYAGALAQGDSVTTNVINGFSSKTTCDAAAKQAEGLVSVVSTKVYRSVCVEVK